MGIFWDQNTRNKVFHQMMELRPKAPVQMAGLCPSDVEFREKNGKMVFRDSKTLNEIFIRAQQYEQIGNAFRRSQSTKELEELLPQFCVDFYHENEDECELWVIDFVEAHAKLNTQTPVVQPVDNTQIVQDQSNNVKLVEEMNETILFIGQQIVELGSKVTLLSEQLNKLRDSVNSVVPTNEPLKKAEPVKIKHIVLFGFGMSEFQTETTKGIMVTNSRDVALVAAEYPDIERVTIALTYTSTSAQAAIQNTFGGKQGVEIVRFIGSAQRVAKL